MTMTHPLVKAVNAIIANPTPSKADVKFSDVPYKPWPEYQRQREIKRLMDLPSNQQYKLINFIAEQVRSEEYWGNRNDI